MNKSLITTTPAINDNQESPKVHYWWLNLSSEDWDITEGEIGDKKIISSSNENSFSLVEATDVEFVNWLDSYFIDSEDNPHFGIPIAHKELAISYFDFIGRDVNNKTLTNSVKANIKKKLLKYLPKAYVCNPPIVFQGKTDHASKMRCCAAWEYPTNKDGSIRTDKKGNRLPRILSKNNYPKCFYFYRKNEIPRHPYDKKHIGEKDYVQPAPKDKDPEIGFDNNSIKSLNRSSSENFHKGDFVLAYDTESKQITGLLNIIKVNDEKISLQIKEIYNEPIHIDKLDGKEYISGDIDTLLPLDSKEYKIIRKEIISNNPEFGTSPYSWEHLQKEAFVDARLLDDINQTLTEKKCVILQGAPGVGKTFLAKRIAYARMGQKDDSHIKFVQFHPNYTYEDFIIGYKPKESKQQADKKNDGRFVLTDGVFKAFCKEASKPSNSTKDYYFIIDEINRGNISKIFGEAFSMLEYRDNSIVLAYSQKTFRIPKNVYIIGLMNTADRSLAMIDFALRRRFAFFTLRPAFEESSAFKKYQESIRNSIFDRVIAGIVELNKTIAKDPSLGEGFCVGHSYFCFIPTEDVTNDRLRRIIKYEIIPMLQEYWFDNVNKFKDEAKKLEDLVK